MSCKRYIHLYGNESTQSATLQKNITDGVLCCILKVRKEGAFVSYIAYQTDKVTEWMSVSC